MAIHGAKKYVKLDFDIVGFHAYKDAPKKVEFLRYPHRHDFQIKVKYIVSDMNREKEIFIQTDIIKDYLYEAYGNPCQFGDMSCEMIAMEILEFAQEDGVVYVEVLEDGKGGAIVEL